MAMKFGNGIDLDGQRVVNVGDPSSNTDAANKQYVDAFVRGLSWKNSVVAASTANVTVSSAPSSLDGVTLSANDRVLLKNQSTASENGIYVFASAGAALTRATDADSAAELAGATVTVTQGSTNADKVFRLITDSITLGSTSLSFTELGGGGTVYSADGEGIEETGGQFSLELDGSTLSKSASGLRLATGVAGAGLVYNGSALDVNVGSGLEVSSDALRIAAGAAGDGLTGGGGSALAVNVGAGLEISSDAVRIASGAAGSGLTGGGGSALAVGQGTGISVTTDAVAVDSTVARVYATTIGDNSTTNIVVTHSLGTRDIQVTVRNASAPYEEVIVDNEATSTTTCTLRFATAPTTGQYRVIVTGVGA